jgi:pimeloyl-ACP methyl ester carboxylesterase
MAPVTTEGGKGKTASTITTHDGTRVFFKDWGEGQPVVFSHGWPLNADAWESQMVFLAQNGYRAIAHDRRGHGRSSQPSGGNEMDTYADDLATLIEELDLRDAVLVGHSTGGGEVTRYVGRHGTSRVAKAVLVSAVPPLMLKTEANPDGQPIEVFDETGAALAAESSQFYRDLADGPFYGANRPDADVSQVIRDVFWFQSGQAGLIERIRVHKGLLGDGLHGGPEEVRRPHPDRPRRRRPDRADRRGGAPVVRARPGRDAEGLRGRAARTAQHAHGPAQRRPAGVPQGVSVPALGNRNGHRGKA